MRAKPDICNAMQLDFERTSRTTVFFFITIFYKRGMLSNALKWPADATNRGLAMVEAGLLS